MANKRQLLFSAVAFASVASVAFGQQLPAGTKGKDWAREVFDLGNVSTVIVTANNQTINATNGNKSGIRFVVNGASAETIVVDRAYVTSSIAIKGAGHYVVDAICTNERADAYTCTIGSEAEKARVYP